MNDRKFVSDRFERNSEYDTLVASFDGVMVRYRVLPNGDAIRERIVANDSIHDPTDKLDHIHGMVLSGDINRIVSEGHGTIAEQ